MARRNTYSYYQTNHPNILGGLMTYNDLSKAIDACKGGWGTKVYVVTCVRRDNNMGIMVPDALSKELWRTVIWKK
jgi:hypothetical protein